eukprot:6197798-Pleurochrysis_carterae.AAC.3
MHNRIVQNEHGSFKAARAACGEGRGACSDAAAAAFTMAQCCRLPVGDDQAESRFHKTCPWASMTTTASNLFWIHTTTPNGNSNTDTIPRKVRKPTYKPTSNLAAPQVSVSSRQQSGDTCVDGMRLRGHVARSPISPRSHSRIEQKLGSLLMKDKGRVRRPDGILYAVMMS